MEKQFKVAFLGIKAGDSDATEYEDMVDRVGITTFTMNAEKILDVVKNLEKQGRLDSKKFGIIPEKHCGEFVGGRSMYLFSREEIMKTVEEIEVLIVSTITEYYSCRYFLMWLTPDNLPKSCTIVFRLPFCMDEKSFDTRPLSEWIKSMGMDANGQAISKKRSKKKNRSNAGCKQIFAVGLEEFGGTEPKLGIQQLQSALYRQELKEEIIKPVKETVSAGKSFLDWGRTFTSWMSKLVSSN